MRFNEKLIHKNRLINTMTLYSVHSDFPKFFFQFSNLFQYLSIAQQLPGSIEERADRQASGGQNLHNGDNGVVTLWGQRSIQGSLLSEVTAQQGQETGYVQGDRANKNIYWKQHS